MDSEDREMSRDTSDYTSHTFWSSLKHEWEGINQNSNTTSSEKMNEKPVSVRM